MRPPVEVQAAFGASGSVSKVRGGRGNVWRVGDVMLKPVDLLPEELNWLDKVPREHSAEERIRLSLPLKNRSQELIVDGWTAFPYLVGEHRAGHWSDVAKVATEFAALFSGAERPRFIDLRDHAWARADRFAWGESKEPSVIDASHVENLISARREVTGSPGIVHGDLTGNVLFDPDLPPAVIDLTVYWRPLNYSIAIVATDAVCFEGAPLSLFETISPDPDFAQYAIRSLLFRIVTDCLNGLVLHGVYDAAVERILELAWNSSNKEERP